MAKLILTIDGPNDELNRAMETMQKLNKVTNLTVPYIAQHSVVQTAKADLTAEDFGEVIAAAVRHLNPRRRLNLQVASLENFKLCPHCNFMVFNKAKFCSNCGQALTDPLDDQLPEQDKEKMLESEGPTKPAMNWDKKVQVMTAPERPPEQEEQLPPAIAPNPQIPADIADMPEQTTGTE